MKKTDCGALVDLKAILPYFIKLIQDKLWEKDFLLNQDF